jgi:hypothetical protein
MRCKEGQEAGDGVFVACFGEIYQALVDGEVDGVVVYRFGLVIEPLDSVQKALARRGLVVGLLPSLAICRCSYITQV